MTVEALWRHPTTEEIDREAQNVCAGDTGYCPTLATDREDRGGYWKWEPSDADLPDSKLVFLYAHWKALRGGDPMPRAGALDPLELGPALGFILLLDVLDEGRDCQYRVYGSRIADAAGRDWTGRTLSEMNQIIRTDLSLFYRSCYRAVYLQRKPLFTTHGSHLWLRHRTWRRLILPLQDDAGKVSRFLVGNIPDNARHLSPELLREQQRRLHGE